MEEEKRGFIGWVKEHKKELIIAGISVAAIIAAILCIRHKAELEALFKSLKKAVSASEHTIPVPDHVSAVSAAVSEPACLVKEAPEIVPIITRAQPQIPFDVSEHLRVLPEGWHASPEKIATAAEHGYNLLPGQTWVETYTKNICAA